MQSGSLFPSEDVELGVMDGRCGAVYALQLFNQLMIQIFNLIPNSRL